MPNRKSTVKKIREHSRNLVRELDLVKSVYLSTGYTFTQCHVLFEIHRNEAIGLMDLVNILLIDKSNASRTLKKLVQLGLVRTSKGASDQRQKKFSLTEEGELALKSTIDLANVQVNEALANLNPAEHEQVIEGMRLYANALRKGRLQEGYTIRRIKKKDNAQVAAVIRGVMTEFAAVGEGYSIGDPEVDDMYGNYRDDDSAYYVIEFESKVVGCGGVARLKGGKKTTCELRKMFFLPETRGRGLGRRLLLTLLDDARKFGYSQCYIETLKRMRAAVALYEKNGFERLDTALGKTGHCGCDCHYALEL